MTDLEYAVRRSVITEQVLDDLLHVVAYALPHTQEQLSHMLLAWQEATDKLDAERRRARSNDASFGNM